MKDQQFEEISQEYLENIIGGGDWLRDIQKGFKNIGDSIGGFINGWLGN